MASSTTFKIGLLAIAVAVAAVGLVFALGLRRSPSDTYHTYFDETVQGLDVGAPVKYRGVRIGNVSTIRVAPDHKHVDVALALERGEARRLGLERGRPQLRARLAIQGVTGVKFIDIDFADPATPLPTLTFTPARRYIPSRPSMLEDLGRDLAAIGHRVPHLVDRAIAALTKVEQVVDDLRASQLPSRVAAAIDNANAAIAEARALIRSVDRARLPDRARVTADKIDLAIARLDGVLARIGGDDGLVASARRATESFGDAGRSTQDSAVELERTLHDLGDAVRAFRDFIEEVDRDPDVLVKGRARTNKP
jgi:ABC-type transporter Mla subunit MlaD